jgi:septal ring factor EnvC (AmiA/AmiB activator)
MVLREEKDGMEVWAVQLADEKTTLEEEQIDLQERVTQMETAASERAQALCEVEAASASLSSELAEARAALEVLRQEKIGLEEATQRATEAAETSAREHEQTFADISKRVKALEAVEKLAQKRKEDNQSLTGARV